MTGGVDADLTHTFLESAKEKKNQKNPNQSRDDTRSIDCNGEYQK